MDIDPNAYTVDFINGKLPRGYSDSQWQLDFNRMREHVVPACTHKMDMGRVGHLPGGFTYDGKTQWQYYCTFINGVLGTIRRGLTDYCFFTYQIEELLKYEPRRLRTRWLADQCCFKVWLDQPSN